MLYDGYMVINMDQIKIIAIVLSAILGLCVGSFLNVVICEFNKKYKTNVHTCVEDL